MPLVISPHLNYFFRKIILLSGKRRKRIFIVGGFLRDALIGLSRPGTDIDFCLKNGAINFGRELSRSIGAGFVVLDRERGCCRLVKSLKGSIYTLDFSDFRGKALEDDLSLRDFTINALALELTPQVLKGRLTELVDSCAALRDIRSRKISFVDRGGFDDDPLRILRAFSLSAALNFKITPETLALAKKKKEKLRDVSGERIRDEVFKILKSADAFSFLQQMDTLRILEVILPEISAMRGRRHGPYHHLDIWKHSLESLRQLELFIAASRRNRDIAGYLDEVISAERPRLSLLKIGTLLHDIGKPAAMRRKGRKIVFHGHERIGERMVTGVARRLKLSNDETAALRQMVMWHLRPGYLADNQRISPRAKFRYFRDAGKEAASILLIAIADQRSTCGPLSTKRDRLQHERSCVALLREYFRKQKEKEPPRLISGDDLIAKFRLEPSPLIGDILRQVRESQAIGKVKTRRQALQLAERTIRGARN